MITRLGLIRCLWAQDALLPTGWARDVLLQWNEDGQFSRVEAGQPCPPGGLIASGPVVPGMPNLHSHAFQRVMAGLTETRGPGEDSFWSWRRLMYRFAQHLSPTDLEAIATALYMEMLEAGYTQVCEFHYLHHQVDGRPYAQASEMSQAIIRAAARSGIGLTLLPVLYQASGIGGASPLVEQRRFLYSTQAMLELLDQLTGVCRSQQVRLGAAAHSLRAVTPAALDELISGLVTLDRTAPIHIHIAEQQVEVDACLSWSGQRPVAWLLDHAPVDQRWCLVHATHTSQAELQALAATGAAVGLCPSTEANLGDGLFDFSSWQAHAGRWGIGSDSHVMVSPADELMWLEYGQRLQLQRRNIATRAHQPDTATTLWLDALDGGARACGRAVAGLRPGQRADWLVLNASHPLLDGLTAPQMLASHLFASSRHCAIQSVWTKGECCVENGAHSLSAQAWRDFNSTRRQLLQHL
jgi:formimidoylglutamate deiminase